MIKAYLMAATAVLAAPAGAATTVLTFNTGEVACASAANDGAVASQVCATSGSGPNGQIIGSNYGSSADLAVSYDASESTGSRTSLHFNTAGGGVATAFPVGPADELSKIIFTPASGFEVSFTSFSWIKVTATSSADFIFRVLDPNANVLFTAGNGDPSYVVNSAYFAGPVTFEFGNGGRGAAAVDNVTVDVRAITAPPPAIPEPATWAMMIAGFALAGTGARLRSRGNVLA